MKKRTSTTKTAQIRAYIAANPDTTAKKVAELFKVSSQSVYQITYKMRKAAAPKKIILGVSEVTLANKLGVSTQDYAEKVYELTKGRTKQRMVIGSSQDIVATHHTDMVNHPPHYKAGGMETIDFIEAKALGYHLGNVVKYVTRADHKGNKLEDLKKAQWYLNRAIETLN